MKAVSPHSTQGYPYMALLKNTTSLPRTIIFDLGKVLVDFDHMTFCRNLAPFCRVSADEVYRRIFRSGVEKYFDSGQLSPTAFFEAVRTALSPQVDIDQFELLWSDIFTLNDGIDALLIELKPHYRLLCLSNTNPWHFNWCRRHFAILNIFDDFILSYEERCCKPDSAIYQKAIKKAHALPEQCIFIDDNADNVQAASRLGIHAFVFTSVAQLTQDLSEAGIACHA
jgi:glucose-1-phosphatase